MKLTRKELRQIINESMNEGFFDGVKNFFGFGGGTDPEQSGPSVRRQGENIVAFAVNMAPLSTRRGSVHHDINEVIAKEFSESEQSRGLASLLGQLQNPGVLKEINTRIYQASNDSEGVTMPTITGVYGATRDYIRLECDLLKGNPDLAKRYKLELTPLKVHEGFKQVLKAGNVPSYALPRHMPVDGRIEQLLCRKLFFYSVNPLRKFKR